MKLFLDMDGVLANFDKEATYRLGSNLYEFEFKNGPAQFWEKLHERGDFFASLDPMPDFPLLWNAVKHLDVSVLTALPKTGAEEVARQKGEWCTKHLGLRVPVITCLTSEKPNYSRYGAILVDDRNVNEEAWEDKGGIFIHHRSAAETVLRLQALGVL